MDAPNRGLPIVIGVGIVAITAVLAKIFLFGNKKIYPNLEQMFPTICHQLVRAVGKNILLPALSLYESKQFLLPLNIVIMEKIPNRKRGHTIEYSTCDMSLTELLTDEKELETDVKHVPFCSYNQEGTYSLNGKFQAGDIIGVNGSGSARGTLTSKLGYLLLGEYEKLEFKTALEKRTLDMNNDFIKQIKDAKKVLCVIRGVISTSDKAVIKCTNKTEGIINVSEKVFGNINAGIEADRSSVGEIVIEAGTILAYKVCELKVDVDSGEISPMNMVNHGGFFKNKNQKKKKKQSTEKASNKRKPSKKKQQNTEKASNKRKPREKKNNPQRKPVIRVQKMTQLKVKSREKTSCQHNEGNPPPHSNETGVRKEYNPQRETGVRKEYNPQRETGVRKEYNPQRDEDEVEESSEESLDEHSGILSSIDDEDEVEESSEESLEEHSDEDEVALTLKDLRDILQPLRDCTKADSRAIKSSLLDLMTCYSDVVAMSKILSKAENGTIKEDKDSLDEHFINNDTVWSILTFVGVQTEKGRVLYEREATPIFIAVAYMIDVILELENDDLENIYYFDEPQVKTLSKIFESAVASSETIISIDENMSSVLKEPVSSFLTRQKFTVCNDSIQPPKPKTCMLEDIFSVLYFLS